jgi:sulfite reductase (ferredoxin)
MPARQQRGQGQWALGHFEPLNAAERFKKDDAGLNVRDRIINRYSMTGFDSIDPTDLRGRFRWWGLYTQRRPGIAGGRTGMLEDEDIQDRYFMMRVRIPGGQLTSHQVRTIGGVAKEFGRDLADLTDRQNVQFHWITIEDVPTIWQRLEEAGLSTIQACGDVPRNILGCPVAGIDASEILDATAVLQATEEMATSHPEKFGNLPRKFKTAISGCASHCTVHEINDVSFVGVLGPDGQPGFDVWVGGGLSTNPMLAQRLGAFVLPEQVPAVWAGIAEVFRDYGYRRLRTRARIKFLVADWGPEKFREVLEDEYLGFKLADGQAPPPPAADRSHVGVHAQQDGNYYVGVAPHVGRTSGSQLWQVADLADEFGSGRLRTTTEQKLLILDIPERNLDQLVASLKAIELEAQPSPFRRGTMACTGLEFCKLAIVETKGRARDLYGELERRLPEFDAPISINLNGCPNSCARFQLADIGLKGSIVDGEEGFQVHLGGSLGADPSFGRKLRGLKVTADGLPDYVERLLRNYQAGRTDGEPFATWVRRADEGLLS